MQQKGYKRIFKFRRKQTNVSSIKHSEHCVLCYLRVPIFHNHLYHVGYDKVMQAQLTGKDSAKSIRSCLVAL